MDKNYGSIKRLQSNNPSTSTTNNNRITAFEQNSDSYFSSDNNNNQSNTPYNHTGHREKGGKLEGREENGWRESGDSLVGEFRRDSERLLESIGEVFARVRDEGY